MLEHVKAIGLSVGVVVLALSGSGAAAQEIEKRFSLAHDDGKGFYLRGGAGQAALGDPDWLSGGEFGDGWRVSGAAGWRFTRYLRVEAEVAWRGGATFTGTDGAFAVTGEARSLAGMVNGYLDIGPYWGRMMPYIGAGVGVARNSTDTFTYTGAIPGTREGATSTNPAWQVMIGAGFYLTEQIVLDVGYRHFDGGDLAMGASGTLAGSAGTFSSSGAGSLTSSDLTAGLRVHF